MNWNIFESKLSEIKDMFIEISEMDGIEVSFGYGYAGLSYIIGKNIKTYDHLLKLMNGSDILPSDVVFHIDIKSDLCTEECDIEMWGDEFYNSVYLMSIDKNMLESHILITNKLIDVYKRLSNISTKILLDTKFLNYSFIIHPNL